MATSKGGFSHGPADGFRARCAFDTAMTHDLCTAGEAHATNVQRKRSPSCTLALQALLLLMQ
eukprot:362245-Chlamydomonas_euryale.AAC.3